MRILSINSHYQDKLGYQDYYLGKALMSLGHEVIFITSDRHFDYPDYENTVAHIIGPKYVGVGEFINDYGATVIRLPINRKVYFFGQKILLKGFLEKLNSLKPDLIISHNLMTYQSILLSTSAIENNPVLIFDDHTTINLLNKRFISRFLYSVFRLLFSKRIYRVSKRIIGISHTCIEVINKYFGLSGDKVEMIPLGSDTELFFPDILKRKTYRQNQLGIKDDTVVLTYTGKIYSLKSVVEMIEVINEIQPLIYYSTIIHIVGDVSSDYQEVFVNAINASSVKIVYRKAVTTSELVDIYNASDICIWPNHLTNSTVDASACACAIICSNYMPERVKSGNGIAIKPGDKKELSEALIKLINDPQLRLSMGLLGREYVENELSWTAIARNFIRP